MADKKENPRHLESGDNPEERKKSLPTEKEQDKKDNDSKDLESGDNPEERKRSSDR